MRCYHKIIFALPLLGLSACIDPVDYESEPVQVKTSKGIVTCQLYRQNTVLWDRAIKAPKGMSIKEADEVCVKEGKRRLGQS